MVSLEIKVSVTLTGLPHDLLKLNVAHMAKVFSIEYNIALTILSQLLISTVCEFVLRNIVSKKQLTLTMSVRQSFPSCQSSQFVFALTADIFIYKCACILKQL